MTQHTIKSIDIERLLREGKLEQETVGDVFTGRVYWDIEFVGETRRFYYHKSCGNPKFYVRED